MPRAGATLHRGARASHYRGLSCCGAQAPDAQAQQLWCTGPVAPWHVGSSQTRARTRVPCISRQTLNHCATREAHFSFILKFFKSTKSTLHPEINFVNILVLSFLFFNLRAHLSGLCGLLKNGDYILDIILIFSWNSRAFSISLYTFPSAKSGF